MSILLMNLAFQTPLPPAEKLVLLCLCDWANDEGGRLYPSIEQVAKKATVSESTARRILQRLIADGLLAVVGNEAGGRGKAREYAIIVEALEQKGVKLAGFCKRVSNDEQKGVKLDDKRVSRVTPQPLFNNHQITINTPPIVPPSEQSFDDFWRLYPATHCPKAKAMEAWHRAVKAGADPADILAGLSGYVDFLRLAPSAPPAAHPSTWLNQQRWGVDYRAALEAEQERDKRRRRSIGRETEEERMERLAAEVAAEDQEARTVRPSVPTASEASPIAEQGQLKNQNLWERPEDNHGQKAVAAMSQRSCVPSAEQ